jgi:hypothetical protein
MKKYLSALLFITGSIGFMSNSFAFDCPSVSQIKAVTFNYAVQSQNDKTVWYLSSAAFNFDGKSQFGNSWNVIFSPGMPNVKTSDEAIKLGTAIFAKQTLGTPIKYSFPAPATHDACTYETENGAVTVLTPPGTGPKH